MNSNEREKKQKERHERKEMKRHKKIHFRSCCNLYFIL